MKLLFLSILVLALMLAAFIMFPLKTLAALILISAGIMSLVVLVIALIVFILE